MSIIIGFVTSNCGLVSSDGRLTSGAFLDNGFLFRSIDLILIASPTGDLGNLKIYNSRFKPNSNNTSIIIEDGVISPRIKNNVYWKLFGDDTSQTAVDNFLKIEIGKISRVNEQTLRSLSYKAIRHGIKNSSKHIYGDDLMCGGKPFVKSIK